MKIYTTTWIFRVFRYEDLIDEEKDTLEDFTGFFNLEKGNGNKEIITSKHPPLLHSQRQQVRKESEDKIVNGPHQWRKKMSFEEVSRIQDKCHKALRIFGYRDAKDEFELYRFDPVEPLPNALIENIE